MAEETVKQEFEKLPCTTCQLEFSNQTILDAHMSGSKHQKKILANQLLEKLTKTETCFTHDTVKGTYTCLVCNIELTSPQLLEAHFSGNKHKQRATGGDPAIKQPAQQQQATSNGQASKRQLNPAAPPAKRVTGAVAPTEAGADGFKCKECDKSFNSDVQMTQHLASSKHRNRCLIAMFGTCNLEDSLTKTPRGRGGQGNSRGRGRGRGGSGGSGRGRGNYQGVEWNYNSSMRGNNQPIDYGNNGLTQPTSDWGCCNCGNRGRGRPNQGQQQRTFTAAWEDNYDNIHYSSQSGYTSHGGYSDDSSAYVDQNSVTSSTYTNPNHYSNQNLYVDRSRPCTVVSQTSVHDRGTERVHDRGSERFHDRGSVSQGSYQQRGNSEQSWTRNGHIQNGGKVYQGGSRGKPRGKGY